MKIIIAIITLTTLSLSSFAEPSFNTKIPQPDFISNDWDGDGTINSEDTDDDNDGINDIDDSSQFGGRSNKSSIVDNSLYILKWSNDTVPDVIFPNEYTVTSQSMYKGDIVNNPDYNNYLRFSLSKNGLKITDNVSPLLGLIVDGKFSHHSSVTNSQGGIVIYIPASANMTEGTDIIFVFKENIESLTDGYSLLINASKYRTSNTTTSVKFGVCSCSTYSMSGYKDGNFINGNSLSNGVNVVATNSNYYGHGIVGFESGYPDSNFIGVKIDDNYFAYTDESGHQIYYFTLNRFYPSADSSSEVIYYFLK